MKSLLLACLLLTTTTCTVTEAAHNDTVYVCDSPNATRYHYKQTCRGLSNCSHHIVSMSLEKAQKNNLTLCKWER